MGERITLFLLNFQNQFEQKTTSFLIDGILFDILFGNVTGGKKPEVEFLNGIFSRGFWVHRIRPKDSLVVVESRLGGDSKHLLRASLENLYRQSQKGNSHWPILQSAHCFQHFLATTTL
jgi:hypothetical protein